MTFEELQERLLRRIKDDAPAPTDPGSIVVLPSITFPTVELKKIVGIQHYEERMLFLLLLLSEPRLHMVFLTSSEINPEIIDYYLSFVNAADARERLRMITVADHAPTSLTAKLLERPDALEQILDFVPDPTDAYILPFNVTPLEQQLAERLGISLYGPHPDLIPLGSKSGSRTVARAAGVPVLDGRENLFSLDDLESTISALRRANPQAGAVVIKLNNGFSGQGNAIVNLDALRTPLESSPTVFCAPEESWASFSMKMSEQGAIVEELVRSPLIASPSVQLRIAPGGDLEVVSTHEQILGGPDDQVYLGCRFPAALGHRMEIQELALKAGKVLASEGVIGSFGIDFIVVPEGASAGIYLSEINLRVGGTTHTFGMASLATQGSYEPASGELIAAAKAKSYIATDNLKSPGYVGLAPRDVIRALQDAGLAFDPSTRTGATLHLMGALHEHGKLGVVCIANSMESAEDLYEDVVKTLDHIPRPRS